MRVPAQGHTQVLYWRDAGQLHQLNLNPPPPPPLPAGRSQLIDRRPVNDIHPRPVAQLRPDDAGAAVRDGILQLAHFEHRLLHVGDAPGHDRVEPDSFPVDRRSREPGQPRSPWHYVLVDDVVHERDLPVPAPAWEHAQRLTHPQLYRAVVRVQDRDRDQLVPDTRKEV